jgi:hypothetical protein
VYTRRPGPSPEADRKLSSTPRDTATSANYLFWHSRSRQLYGNQLSTRGETVIGRADRAASETRVAALMGRLRVGTNQYVPLERLFAMSGRMPCPMKPSEMLSTE